VEHELKWTPFFSLFKKEITRFLRVVIQTLLIPLVNSFLYLLIFGVSLGAHINTPGEVPYLAFLIPGIIMMAVLNNSLQNSSSSVITSKFHGDLEDLRTVPLSPLQIIAAFSLGGLFRGVLVGTVVLIVGEILYYNSFGAFLSIHNPFILLFFLIVGGLSFALLGISVAFWAKTFDQMSAFGGFILLPLLYLGGVFFSLSQLHPFWQGVSRLNPMLYFINGVRFGMLGQADIAWTYAALWSVASLALIGGLAYRSIVKGSYGRW
jgi:ABC-2 type transport system permease protein